MDELVSSISVPLLKARAVENMAFPPPLLSVPTVVFWVSVTTCTLHLNLISYVSAWHSYPCVAGLYSSSAKFLERASDTGNKSVEFK